MQRFESAVVDIIAHATEDHEKILSIVNDVLNIDKGAFTITSVEGHHGNEIKYMKARLASKDASILAYNIIGSLSIHDRIILSNNLERYVDKNSLYIRISKQDLFKNRIRLEESDVIRIKFKFLNRLLEDLKDLIEHGKE